MADETRLLFASWQRNEIFDRATTLTGGRLTGGLPLSLSDDMIGTPQTGTAPFTLMAAADIGGLKPGAIRHRAPAPFARDAETTKLVHLDLADPDLPWRYSPVPTVGAQLAPWLALLVGTAEEIRVEGGRVTHVEDAVLVAHRLDESHRWAHVQGSGPGAIARIVSPRGMRTPDGAVGLVAQREHLAVLVPTFNAEGDPMWGPDGTRRFGPSGVLPAFDSWRFWTAEPGDFETLAEALEVPPARDVGKARLHYRRSVPPTTDVDVTLEVRGAITSLKQPETAQHDALAAVTGDLDVLDDGLPDTIGLPHYGRPWLPDPDAAAQGWPHELNDDPRFRGSAGLGVWMGVEAQEELMDAAVAQAGALREAGLRIGHLALGLHAAGRLWDRRLPTEPHQRLTVLGPMTARLEASDGGSVLDRITGDTSPLVPGQFSSAARRLLRDRTPTTRHLAGGAVDRAAALQWANQPETAPDRAPDGLPHVDAVAAAMGWPTVEELFELDDRWTDEVMAEVDERLERLHQEFLDRLRGGEEVRALRSELGERVFGEVSEVLDRRMRERGLDCSGGSMFELIGTEVGGDLFVFLGTVPGDDGARQQLTDLVRDAVRHCQARRRCRELTRRGHRVRGFPCDVVVDHVPGPETEVVRPVDLVGLTGIVAGAVDPRGPRPPGKVRLCARLVGVDCGTLAPPEYPIGLDFPTWGLLKQHDREWLLPGADDLPQDSVTALQTNPTFVDAFMVGINTQFMSEMRWRDLAVARTCTPLRMFWGQVDYATHERRADVEPLDVWAGAPDDALGAISHQTIKPHDPGNVSGSRLVITFRSDLFRRYPSTLVYLVRPGPGDDVDALLEAPPVLDMPDGVVDVDAWRASRTHLGPVFAGTLTPELTFFTFDVTPSDLDDYWLVLDEPPSELRFRNDESVKPWIRTSSATTAESTLDQPTRVAISGADLKAKGLA